MPGNIQTCCGPAHHDVLRLLLPKQCRVAAAFTPNRPASTPSDRLHRSQSGQRCVPRVACAEGRQQDCGLESTRQTQKSLAQLWERIVVVVDQTALPTLLLVGALYWLSSGELQAMAADLSDHQPHFHPLAADMNQIAGEEDFWNNVGRYGSYFFSVLLGTAYTAVKPLGGLLRKPVSAFFTVAALIGLYVFVSSTVKAMLGVNATDELLLPPF